MVISRDMKAICLLTVRPPSEYIDFVNTLVGKGYDIFLSVDDGGYNIPPQLDSAVNIILYDNNWCRAQGYWGSVLQVPNRACSRDKALFHFCKQMKQYTHIWFVEQDVYVSSVEAIINIDTQYGYDADLLCKEHIIKPIDDNLGWLWSRVYKKIPQPWARSMICAIRVSRTLLDKIEEYAHAHHRLFLDEAMFNTIALQSSLVVVTPSELSTIEFRRPWKDHEIQPSNLYHPIKCPRRQRDMRHRSTV